MQKIKLKFGFQLQEIHLNNCVDGQILKIEKLFTVEKLYDFSETKLLVITTQLAKTTEGKIDCKHATLDQN